jgi:hypothetical protein
MGRRHSSEPPQLPFGELGDPCQRALVCMRRTGRLAGDPPSLLTPSALLLRTLFLCLASLAQSQSWVVAVGCCAMPLF